MGEGLSMYTSNPEVCWRGVIWKCLNGPITVCRCYRRLKPPPNASRMVPQLLEQEVFGDDIL